MPSLGSPIVSFVENVDQMLPQKHLISLSFLIFQGFNGEKDRIEHFSMSGRSVDTSLH
jgi:hypothetical protein